MDANQKDFHKQCKSLQEDFNTERNKLYKEYNFQPGEFSDVEMTLKESELNTSNTDNNFFNINISIYRQGRKKLKA